MCKADNAPAHASLVVRQFLTSTNRTVIRHTLYSQVLVPCDFFPIPQDEIVAQGATF
jgi:hypothetical protein